MSKHQLAQAVAHLPLTSSPWLVARRRWQGNLDLVLWMNAGGSLLAHDLLPRNAPPEAVWASFRKAMSEPLKGVPCRPRRIRAASVGLGEAVGALAPLLGLEVEVGTSSVLDRAFELLDDSADQQGFSYLHTAGVTSEMVRGLAERAVRLYALAPWKAASDLQMLEIVGLTPEPCYCSILELGLGVFFSREGARVCLRGQESFTRHPGMSILLHDPAEMGPDTVVDIERHGWPLSESGRMVYLIRFDRGENPAPTAEEIGLAQEILDVVLSSVEDLYAGAPFCREHELKDRSVLVTWPAVGLLG